MCNRVLLNNCIHIACNFNLQTPDFNIERVPEKIIVIEESVERESAEHAKVITC